MRQVWGNTLGTELPNLWHTMTHEKRSVLLGISRRSSCSEVTDPRGQKAQSVYPRAESKIFSHPIQGRQLCLREPFPVFKVLNHLLLFNFVEGGGNSDLSVEEHRPPTEGGVTALGFVLSVGNLIPSVEPHPTPSLTANGVN